MEQIKNKGWVVAGAGIGINLALGILYTWSIFKSSIQKSIESGDGVFNWEISQLSDPYSVCCLVFAFSMILAGVCQDKYGPRVTAFIGGTLVSAGLILISLSTNYYIWVIGFGILAGTGIGFGYSSATPPALKWFSPSKTGLIAGLVVSGFGLASVYIAPLSEFLLGTFGIQKSMMIFGASFFIVVCGFSLLLKNPPKGYVPEEVKQPDINGPAPAKTKDYNPKEMLKTPLFWLMWSMYFIGAGTGLMVIGNVAGIAKASMGENAFIVVAIMAVGNAAGRIVAGLSSDRLGRNVTLAGMFLFQAILMFCAIPALNATTPSAFLVIVLATFMGFNYGANLSIFPSYAKDNWGLKSFGINYGILFTAWGVGGFVMSRLSQMIYTATGSYTTSFEVAGVLLIIGSLIIVAMESDRSIKSAATIPVNFQNNLKPNKKRAA